MDTDSDTLCFLIRVLSSEQRVKAAHCTCACAGARSLPKGTWPLVRGLMGGPDSNPRP